MFTAEFVAIQNILVQNLIGKYRFAAKAVIATETAWNKAEKERHVMRVELSQQFRAQGKPQKDSDDLASNHPLYQEKQLDLESLRQDKELAVVDARVASYEVSAAIALLYAAAPIGSMA